MAVVKGWKEELCLVKHLLCLKTQTVPYPPLIILSQIQTIISRLVQGPPEKKKQKNPKTNQPKPLQVEGQREEMHLGQSWWFEGIQSHGSVNGDL